MCEVFKENPDSKLICFNLIMLPFGKVAYFLNQASVVREYFSKETNHTIKCLNRVRFPLINLGFMMTNGPEAMKERFIFNEFFVHEKILGLADRMMQIQSNVVDRQLKEYKLSKERFIEIDLKKLMEGTIVNWITFVLFGCESIEEIEIDLTPLPWIINADHVMDGGYKNTKKTN